MNAPNPSPLTTLREALGEAQKKMLVLAKWEENIHMTSSRPATPYTNGIEGIDALTRAESALKVAEEALAEGFYWLPNEPTSIAEAEAGGTRIHFKFSAALAAIKEARHD